MGRKKDSCGRKQNYVSAKTINYIIKYVTKVDLKQKFYKQEILTSAGIGAGYMKRTDWVKTNSIQTEKHGSTIKPKQDTNKPYQYTGGIKYTAKKKEKNYGYKN